MRTIRRKQNPSSVHRGPTAFDFTLLSELYIHRDGDEVLDFGGVWEKEKVKSSSSLSKNRSFTTEAKNNDVVNNGTFIFLQRDMEDASPAGVGPDTTPLGVSRPKKENSQLMRVEDTKEHIWLVLQPDENQPPYARNFESPEHLFSYLDRKELALPSQQESPPSSWLPTTKWIDIQKGPTTDTSVNTHLIEKIFQKFPVTPDTLENCQYIGGQDRVDTSYLFNPNSEAEYIFFNLSCTPLEEEETVDADPFAQHKPLIHNINTTKSIMEMRFDAVFHDTHDVHVPDPVVVVVIAFRDWVITVHEQPFAEMDDLLRMIQMRCFPEQFHGRRLWHPAEPSVGAPRNRFTSTFLFTSLFQIASGHHIDSVSLAEAINELGEKVFAVKDRQKEQEKAIRHITVVRRCCGECSADISRKEAIANTLLQPQEKQHILLSDPYYREQIKVTKDHLQRIQSDLNNCRDIVALYNWYHNVSIQWFLLRRGNRALRMLLLISECTNIIYPILIVQTLYAMNVSVPFDSEGDPPSETLAPFFVLLALICLYCLMCGRAVVRIFTRKHFKTQLLA